MIHDHLAWHFQLIPSSYPNHQTPTVDNQIHLHSCEGTSTTVEGAHETAATSATFVNAVEGPIQNSSAPTLQGNPLNLERRGPCIPLRPFILEWELRNHPDKALLSCFYLIFDKGCDIAFTGPQFTHIAHNLQSIFAHPSIINDALAVECLNNRIIGPFDSLPNLRCSGLGIVPKHDGGWRTIYHLSAPLGYSINDFIDPSTYTLSYCTVDDAYAIVNQFGPGTLLSKIDLKNAFCLIPVRPADWNLLGIF